MAAGFLKRVEKHHRQNRQLGFSDNFSIREGPLECRNIHFEGIIPPGQIEGSRSNNRANGKIFRAEKAAGQERNRQSRAKKSDSYTPGVLTINSVSLEIC